jgi:hypothetical protein
MLNGDIDQVFFEPELVTGAQFYEMRFAAQFIVIAERVIAIPECRFDAMQMRACSGAVVREIFE